MTNIPIRHIQPSIKAHSSLGNFSIRDVQLMLGGDDMTQELHRHDFFFILALQKGEGSHEIDFISYQVNDNSVFFMRPGQVHKLHLKAGSTGFLLQFDPTFYHPNDNVSSQRLRKASNKNFCEVEVGRFEKLFSVLTYIFNEFTTKQEGYLEVIKANLNIFFVEFVRQSRNSNDTSKSTSSYSLERYEDFVDLLETYITSHKQVSQYADLLNLSTYQLNAITKATVGKSASELINDQILLEARRYLLATPKQVKDIADQLGFEDVSYFIRFFKKHTGYSPEAFRKHSA